MVVGLKKFSMMRMIITVASLMGIIITVASYGVVHLRLGSTSFFGIMP
jgi:hypothetical protein